SWSGNGGGVEYLDMVNNFNAGSLTPWGERLINGVNGIRQTSVEASVFGAQPPTATPGGPTVTPSATSPPPSATPLPGGPCLVQYDVVNQWNTGFQANVKITNNAATAVSGWTLIFSHAPGQQLTSGWNATLSQSGQVVTAGNTASHWNGTIGANGGSVSFGLQGNHNGAVAVPASFSLNGTACNGDTPPTATAVPPTATTIPPTATSVPPTPTAVPPTATSVPPTPTAFPPTATPGGSAYAFDFAVQNQWNSGYVANITVTNNSAVDVCQWQLSFTLNGRLVNGWNGVFTQTGSQISVGPAGWNNRIPANGGSVSVGFQHEFTGTPPQPANFALTTQPCTP
ncbi:MAG: cellulose binding domain-containing protein, partial [Chloroflexota bacterium]